MYFTSVCHCEPSARTLTSKNRTTLQPHKYLCVVTCFWTCACAGFCPYAGWIDVLTSSLAADCPLGRSTQHPEVGGVSIGQSGAAFVSTEWPFLWGHQPCLGPLLEGPAWENTQFPYWRIRGQSQISFLLSCEKVLELKVSPALAKSSACIFFPVFFPVFSRVGCLLKL